MKITLLTVGKIKEKYLRDAIAEYSKRLSKYCKLEIIEVADEKTPDHASEVVEKSIRDKEGERLMRYIRDDDYVVYGDSGYSGADKREEIRNDEHLSNVEFRTNKRPSSIKVPKSYKGINWDKQAENRKSSTRCKVELPFLIVKKQFGYAKVVYRGIAKNMNRFNILFASANLVMCIRAGRSRDFCMA